MTNGVLRRPVLALGPGVLQSLQSNSGCVEFVRRSAILTAGLAYAGSALLDALARLEAGQNSVDDEALAAACAKYILRAAGKPTPFGYFAGVAAVSCDDKACFIPDLDRVAYERRSDGTRHAGVGIVDVQLNPTAIREGSWVCYYLPEKSTGISSPAALKLARASADVDVLFPEADIPEPEDGSPSNKKVASAQYGQLHRFARLELLTEGLLLPRYETIVRPCLEGIDVSTLGDVVCRDVNIQPRTSSSSGDQDNHASEDFIHSLYSSDDARLPRSLASKLADAARRVALYVRPTDPLESFRNRLRQRIDTNFIPLTLACTREFGIGDDGGLRATSNLLHEPTLRATPAVAAFVGREEVDLGQCAHEGAPASDLIPPSRFVYARLVGGSKVHSITLLGAGNGLAAMLPRPGRILPALDALVKAECKAVEAEDPDALFAEVVFLTPSVDGNSACRLPTYDYQIPIFGHASVPEHRQIPVSRLRIGIHNEKLSLFDAKSGRRIVPRISTVQNFLNQKMPCLIRLLGLLQYEDNPSHVWWTWGDYGAAPFLPRIRCGDVIVSPRRWRWQPLLEPGTTPGGPVDVQSWRRKSEAPRFCALRGPNVEFLPVDLDSAVCRRIVAKAIGSARRKGDVVELIELDGAEQAEYENIVISEVVLRSDSSKTSRAAKRAAESRTRVGIPSGPHLHRVESRFPGGDWVYLKIYAGPQTLDDLIRFVLPLVRHEIEEIEGPNYLLFFVRYADPDSHLRIRARVGPSGRDQLLSRILDLPTASDFRGRVARVELATYVPETSQYGNGVALETWHRWASIDSLFAEQVARRMGTASWHARLPWSILWSAQYAAVFGLERFTVRPRRSSLPSGVVRRLTDESVTARALHDELVREKSPAYSTWRGLLQNCRTAAGAIHAQEGRGLASSAAIERGLHLHFNRMMPEVPMEIEPGFFWAVRAFVGWMRFHENPQIVDPDGSSSEESAR